MPKRKAPTKLSGLTGSDDEDLMQVTGSESAPAQQLRDEPPAKKRRGRPRTSNDIETESKPTAQAKKRDSATATQEEALEVKKTSRRGRPRGSSRTSEAPETQLEEVTHNTIDEHNYEQENEDPMVSRETKTTRAKRAAKPAPTRRTARATSAAKQVITDGGFEYTPSGSKQTTAQESRGEPEPSPRPRAVQRRQKEAQAADPIQNDESAPEVIDESILPDEAPPLYAPFSAVKSIRSRLSSVRNTLELSPRKRKSGEAEQGGDPELRRRIGDLTKKHDALESKYRNLREIGVIEASTNMEKLRKQCDTITTASNELVASLKLELEAQRALGQQSRALQKQVKERDNEISRLQSQAEESRAQLAASQTEIKALQTKLAAARNTAASLENTVKVPGSAIKGGPANRAVAAANAEAAQAAQIAQLKEDLYSDLTGLIVRGVKDREADHLYDCIQTGVNGTLHFKLAIPKVPSAEYEKAVFEYLPLLDASRDRELVDILPDFLIDHITFEREQAPKFYTRVIDALTKRRSSTASRM